MGWLSFGVVGKGDILISLQGIGQDFTVAGCCELECVRHINVGFIAYCVSLGKGPNKRTSSVNNFKTAKTQNRNSTRSLIDIQIGTLRFFSVRALSSKKVIVLRTLCLAMLYLLDGLEI